MVITTLPRRCEAPGRCTDVNRGIFERSRTDVAKKQFSIRLRIVSCLQTGVTRGEVGIEESSAAVSYHPKLSSFASRKLKLSDFAPSGVSRRGILPGGEVLLLLPVGPPLLLPMDPGAGLGRLDELGVLKLLSESDPLPLVDIEACSRT